VDGDIDEQLMAWAAMRRPRANPRSAWFESGLLVLVACLGLHLAFFTWLHRHAPRFERQPRVVPAPLQVHWIAAADRPSPVPMPRRSRAPRSIPPVATRPPSLSPPAPSVMQSAEVATPSTASPATGSARLTDPLGELELLSPGESGFGPPDPLRPRRVRLPGSADRIVGRFDLRREITPRDVVNAVGGMLFGGNYNPCPDLRAKVHQATLLHPEQYDDAERRDLIERERRCRYR
jgi:hypothetical protein